MVKFSIYDESKLDAQIELVQDVIKDGFEFLARKAKEAGYDTLWYEARDVENVELHKELGLKMEPTYGFTLRV